MPNPNINQGTLNRLSASVIVSNYPQLNVTPSFLLPEMIDLSFEGQATSPLPSATGVVQSPEPYQLCRLVIHLNKGTVLPSLYKAQMETNTLLGPCTVYPDSVTLAVYSLDAMAITGVDRLMFNGRDAGWVATLTGAYYLNAALWP